MKGHGSYTSFSSLFLLKVRKTGFSSFLTSAGPYPALPRAPVLWSGLLQGWGYAQGHTHGLGKKSLVLNVFLGTVVSIAESEKILYTPKAKTWLTRPVLSNLSNLNYYSLKLKVFKWVVVNDPSRSLGQHVTCRACSSKHPSLMIEDRNQDKCLKCLGWLNPTGQCPQGSSSQPPGPAMKPQHPFQTPRVSRACGIHYIAQNPE